MLWFRAPAKINLTLHVIGRRADGYHDIESLVAFGGICDWLGYEPGADLELEVCGPRALEAGAVGDNLVLRAARALASRIPRLTLGRFRLVKRLPGAAGLGGGSADAAAALRALADANGLRHRGRTVAGGRARDRSGRSGLPFAESANDDRDRGSSRARRSPCRALSPFWSIPGLRPRRSRFSRRWALRTVRASGRLRTSQRRIRMRR